jgi:fermentation-respiration switch protein FrsA (DUF1100 family)
MNHHPLLALAAAATLIVSPDLSATPAPPATQPAWLSAYFRYERPKHIFVEETTPTAEQLNFYSRPRQMRPQDGTLPVAAQRPAEPKTIGEMNVRRLRFRDADDDIVTALLCTPANRPGPFPLAIAVHGLNSNKAQVCGQIAPALAKQGFAVLAPDMPIHGERPGSPQELFAEKNWLKAIELHRRAIIDIRQCIDLAEQRAELDLTRGVVLAGYSLGSWLDSVAGPLDERVKAMVLMVGGATDAAEAAPLLSALPQLAAVDPTRALPHFSGRPLLMLNGTHDPTVTPAMAQRLFAAAAEPKQLKWYDSGHRLPEQAYRDAAEWIAQTWTKLRS